MSSRALRRAQREREEQDRLNRLEQEEGAEEDEDEIPSQPAKKSVFAMLEGDEADEQDENEPVEHEEDEDEESHEPALTSTPKSSSKKKKKKKKSKANTVPATQDQPTKAEELDEIDQALKQLSTNNTNALSGTTTAGVDATKEETYKLLAIDSNHLHAQNEMRRLFGRAALESQNDEEEQPQAPQNAGGNRRQQRQMRQVGLAEALRRQGAPNGRSGGLASIALRKNIFVQGKEEWPVATGGGLGMEIEEKRPDGTILYRFVHNRVYQDVQAQFEMGVQTMDPNQLVALLQHNPYHISTLLQVSEIAKHEGSHSTTGDLLERALFSFGRAVHSTFSRTLAEGKARIDFRRPENREFWLAAWRYMQNLSMRGTWRTVYEWAKLLLSLSPEDDPYGMLLVLDQYALRARQDIDYLNLSRSGEFKDRCSRISYVQLSQGLAEWRAGNKNKGQQALFRAVGRYPWVVARLMHELNLDAPPSVWGKEPRSEKEKLYSELYATRAKDVWNTPETTALLVEISSAIQPDTPAADVDNTEIERNEARHVLLSDTPALIALVPRRYTAGMQSSSDVLPPEDSYLSYLADMPRAQRPAVHDNGGAPTDPIRELQNLYGFFANLFPWFRPEGDANGADDGPPPTQAEVERRIQDSGVDEEVIVERTRRMVELQNRIRGTFGEDAFDHDRGLPEGGVGIEEGDDLEDQEGDEEHRRHARVEDVDDAGD